MDRIELINSLIQKYSYKRYLEIGVDKGLCFGQIVCESKEGVDPGSDDFTTSQGAIGDFQYGITYPVTSDKFFEQHAPFLEKYDIIFIDGLHHSDQVDKDIKNALQYLNEGGTIVLHDCNPLTEESQIVPRIQGFWHGDVWKSVVRYRDKREMGCIVIDDDCGLGLINKYLPRGPYFETPSSLTYSWLEQNRNNALHLVSVEDSKHLLDI